MTHRRTVKSSIGDASVRTVPQKKIVVEDLSDYDPYAEVEAPKHAPNDVPRRETPPRPNFLEEFPDAVPMGAKLTRDGSAIDEPEEFVEEVEEVVSPRAVSRLEVIIGMTRLIKEVKFKNISFLIGTLKSKEHKDMIISVINDDVKTQAEQSFSIRRHTLARAIQQINGTPIHVALGSNKFEDRLMFIDELDEGVVQKLFVEYEAMREEHTKSIEIDLGSTSQEVAESIKK